VRACARARVRLCACARFFFLCVLARVCVLARDSHVRICRSVYVRATSRFWKSMCVFLCFKFCSRRGWAVGGGLQCVCGGADFVGGCVVCCESRSINVPSAVKQCSLCRQAVFPLPSSSVPSAVKQCSLCRQAVFPLPSARVRVSISLSLSSVSLLHPCSVCLRLPLTPPSSTLFVWSSRMMIDQLGCQARRAHHSRRRLRANCGEALALACPPRCTVYRGPCLIV
jgi:hypothetical protein